MIMSESVVDTSSCDQCIAPYQVSTFHPKTGRDRVLRFCGHHFEQARAGLAEQGWLTMPGSAAEILASIAAAVG